jgi:transposase
MSGYTSRQVNRALAQEQLLKRLDQGEDFERLCEELELSHSRDYMPELRRRYREGGSSWEALIDHRHGHPSKGTPERRAWLREQKRKTPSLTQQELADLFEEKFEIPISQGQVSNILREEGVAIPGGQRYRAQEEEAIPIERAGVFFPSECSNGDGGARKGDPGDPGAEKRLPRT